VVSPEALEQPFAAACRLRHVLVVEDNADAAEALALLLQTWGHNVRIARNGPDAIEAAKTDPPDTVLLDIRLPGMNGFHVAEQLRTQADLKKARLVAMTGYEPAQEDQAYQRTFERLLTKPVDPKVLQEVLS
jgi:two-component system CheB/CheR fusion protein